LLTESFVKFICLVSVCDHLREPFLSGAPYAYCGAPCTLVVER